MAFITSKIGTGRIWYAVWNDASGKRPRESTGFPVAGNSTLTPAQAKAMAEQYALGKECAANGTPVDKVIDAVRAVGARDGMDGRVPTLREFLAGIPATTSESSEKNRRRSFKVFMEFLAVLFETIIKMVFVGAVAFGGICLGRYLRKKKDEKDDK